MSAILSVRDLEKTFGSVVAARDITLDVPAQQTVGIIGANGAGKTTFVNMITGHLRPTKGTIRFEEPRHHRPALARDHAARHLTLVPGGADFSLAHRVREHVRARPPRPRSNGAFRARAGAAAIACDASARRMQSLELFRIARLPRTPARRRCRRACASCSTSPWRWSARRACCCSTSRPAASRSRRSSAVMDVVMSALKSRQIDRAVRRARHGDRGALRRPRAGLLRRHRDRRRRAGGGARRPQGADADQRHQAGAAEGHAHA